MDEADINFLIPAFMFACIFLMGLALRWREKNDVQRGRIPVDGLVTMMRPHASDDGKEKVRHAIERSNRIATVGHIWIGYASGVASLVFLILWILQ